MDKLIDIKTAADIVGVSRQRMGEYLRQGRIPGAYKLGGTTWAIPRKALVGFARKPRINGRPKEVENG